MSDLVIVDAVRSDDGFGDTRRMVVNKLLE
jgi:hypothetical protein